MVETRDSAKHPTAPRTAPTTGNDVTPNVRLAEVENPALNLSIGPASCFLAFAIMSYTVVVCRAHTSVDMCEYFCKMFFWGTQLL